MAGKTFDAGPRPDAGVCLTFDDWYIDGWFAARPLFDRYEARATFFVAKPHKLERSAWRKLRQLQDEGHEIGCHTLTHPKLAKFLQEHRVQDYITREVLPALYILQDEGMEVSSFSYPYFRHRPQITGYLAQHFRMVREGKALRPVHAIYPEHSNLAVDVMGSLDRTGAQIGLDYYHERFDLLAAHGGWGVFCGHSLGDDRPKFKQITCTSEAFEEVLALAHAKRLAMAPVRQIGYKHWEKWHAQAQNTPIGRENSSPPLPIHQSA